MICTRCGTINAERRRACSECGGKLERFVPSSSSSVELSRTAARDATESPARGMVCPYCGERFRLTWKRYLGTLNGIHACPRCGKQSKLRIVTVREFLIWIAVTGGLPLIGCLGYVWYLFRVFESSVAADGLTAFHFEELWLSLVRALVVVTVVAAVIDKVTGERLCKLIPK